MRHHRKAAYMLVTILYIVNANTNELNFDDVTVEIEDFNEIDNQQINSPRNARILWPYPLQRSNDSKESETKTEDKESSNEKLERKERFLHWSYPQNPIMDMMLQTVAVHYTPSTGNDPFDFLRDSYPLPKGYTTPLDEYDYIIIGAGSAGSVLAARLTEDKPKATVLLIEAGKPEMLLTDIPMMAPYWQISDYSWPYTMEHQPGVCMGSAEQRCYWPRGKAVGGSSVTNMMFYARGRPNDWDRISAEGNYGWSYNEILPYYMKSERSELRKYKNEPYRGRNGELVVENAPFRTGLIEAFLEAGRIHGNPTIDYNSPDKLGFGYIQTIINKGHRLSVAKAFLHPNKRRKNLHILSEARATKIKIEPQTKRAYAVEYTKNGIPHTARCRREVILSAGPIASPQLLMLSGVGPKEHLQTLGIPVIKDLPVGKTLYDQIAFPGVIFKLDTTNASLLLPKVATLPNLVQWLQYGDGLLASPGATEGLGYIKTSVSNDPEQVPDVELLSHGASVNIDNGGIFRQSWKMTDKTYHTAFGSLNGQDTWSATAVLLHPKSKGYLELRDANPYSHPKMYGNYFTDPKDMKTMIAAIRYIIEIGESEPFKKYGAKLHLAEYPLCKTHPPGSNEYWECAVRTLVMSARHQVGTCKMGAPNDPTAVVDPELRVYGVDGLRVVDSSVIPRTITAQGSAPAIMIGEKAADMLKKTWSNIVT